jgi:hypothetical protein
MEKKQFGLFSNDRVRHTSESAIDCRPDIRISSSHYRISRYDFVKCFVNRLIIRKRAVTEQYCTNETKGRARTVIYIVLYCLLYG